MTRTVLVVDDSAVTRKLVRFALEADGLEVREAATADAAIASARERTPDLVLQDLVLPDVDGFELLDRLRAVVGPQVPVLAFSGLLTKAADARLGASSFDDFISKPVEPSRLREIVRGYFPDAGAAADTFGARRRLLLADDDPVQRKLATFRLTRLGFEVLQAADGAEALELARARRPDVIVSDVLMPRMDGFELCARVRQDPALAAVPVVLLTNSYLEESDFALARRVGADGYVLRTPELSELASVLRTTLEAPVRRATAPRAPEGDVLIERTTRALRQLDRQVALNGALARRNAMLSAELAILRGLTAALVEDGDLDAALDTALSACFDAGGIAWGILLVHDDAAGWSRRAIGLALESDERAARALEKLADDVRGAGAPRAPQRVSIDALRGAVETTDALLTPIVHGDRTLGVLLLGAHGDDDEHRAFAGVVAGQIALVLALRRTFLALEQASESERARARVLEGILDSIDDAILVFDHRYQIVHSNRAARQLDAQAGGPDPREWPRRLHLYAPDQTKLAEWEQLPLIRALHGEAAEPVEFVKLRPGERPLWLSSHARPITNEHGRVEGAVSVTRDITRDKIAQTHQILQDRMASIGVLAAAITHEINNPMSALLVELELAIDDARGTSLHEGLLSAREAAQRVLTIVRDLKTLSRGETDDVAEIDVRSPLEVAVRMATPETRTRATVLLELDEVPRVVANESRLGQVFLNLVVNAAQAIPPGRPRANRIVVRAKRADDGGVLVEIEDTGCGMTPEVRARLFTPFFTTKPVGVGSGLGLSISQRIVQSAGGTIDVDTTPGTGTTFRVWLPAASTRGARGRSASSDRAARVRKRLLVVDEDPLTTQLVRRAIGREHDVAIESSAGDALARLEGGEHFDVLLVDVSVRDERTDAVHDRIGTLCAELGAQVLYAVPRAPTDAVREYLDARSLRTIEKPIDVRALLAIVGSQQAEEKR